MEKIKESLYSRQIGTIGKNTMLKLSNITACIITLDTTGIETAKCLCLLGIKKLFIIDNIQVVDRLIGTNYALSNDDKGKCITQPVKDYLKELNNYVEIVSIQSINNDILSEIDILIQTNISNEFEPLKLNNLCRKYNTKYILGVNIGFSGYIFNDFGENHEITDINGEKTKNAFIYDFVERDGRTLLTFTEDPNEFVSGDKFTFIQPKSDKVYTIKGLDNNQFYIDEVLDFDKSNHPNIMIYEEKQSVIINHTKLESIVNNKLNLIDVTINIEQGSSELKNLQDDIYNICKKPNGIKNKDLCTNHIVNSTSFPIIGSMLGGIIAQEVIKITGKYIPINQELFVDYSELYNSKDLYKKVSTNKKYKNLYELLPRSVIKYLKKMQIFLVGCGALGCEYLKLFSMLDISSSSSGKITVTDMDNIELSNLNRQFLFRNEDIGRSKSITAADKIMNINNKTRILAYNDIVCPETETKFTRSFWDSQDFIVNALDNVEARQYVDSKCVLHQKALFEAGTLGTKCNVQIIIPKKTRTYSETQDPPEKAIPMCTLKNFPFKIEHCIEWSMEIFNTYFNELIKDIGEFAKGKESFMRYISTIDNDTILNEKLSNLDKISDCICKLNSYNIAAFARIVFDDIYTNPIIQLLYNFPVDKLTDSGLPFWSGNKILPNIVNFNTNNKSKDFIEVFTKILCNCFAIQYDLDEVSLNKVCADITPPLFTVNTNFNIKVNDKDKLKEGDQSGNLEQINKSLLNKLLSCDIDSRFNFKSETFEKDDDSNNHVNMITIFSNLRADTYSIEETDNLNCKLIAGRVVPALSTTTTIVTALSVMEMLKYIYTKCDLKYNTSNKDYFINSGINMYLQSEPQKVLKTINGTFSPIYGTIVKTIPEAISIWDTIYLNRLKNGITKISEILEYMKVNYNTNINMLSYRDDIVYNSYEKCSLDICVYKIYKNKGVSTNEYLVFDVSSIDNDGTPIIFPKIVYSWDN